MSGTGLSGLPLCRTVVSTSFQITDSNSAFISNLSIVRKHRCMLQERRSQQGHLKQEENPGYKSIYFPNGFSCNFLSAELHTSEQHQIQACRLVEPRAPEGCCTGRLEQHKEASNSPSGKSPHRSTGNGNAICLLLSRSPLLGAGKKLAHGGGLSVPRCMEVGCRLLGGTCRDQPALLSPFSLFSVCFFRIPVLFICLLPYDIILLSLPSRQETVDSFLLPRLHSFSVPFPVSRLLQSLLEGVLSTDRIYF